MSLTDLKYCREANAKLKAQLSAVTKERDELKRAIAMADLCLIELNLGNYNDDDVRQAQNGMLEATAILRAALQPPVEEQQQ